MSYYVDVLASNAPDIVHQQIVNNDKRASIENELRLFLFINEIVKKFPCEQDSIASPWGNDISIDGSKVHLVFTYSGARIVLPAVRAVATKYGLSVFDCQTNEIVRGKVVPLTLEQKKVSSQAHKYISELKDWTSFQEELDGNPNEVKRLEELVRKGSGPAKRALSFYYYLECQKCDSKERKEHYLQLAYKLACELHGVAYEPKYYIPTYLNEAKKYGIILR